MIIPSYNPDPSALAECLNAVKNSSLAPLEVILVDDCSTMEFPKDIAGFCNIIRNEKNLGPAGARNKGAKEAKGGILCFIDSDVKIERDTLEKISGKFMDEDIAAVQTVYSAFTPVENFTSRYQNLYLRYNFMIVRSRYLSTFASHCIAVKRDAFFDAGGFDEDVKSASIEDEHLGISLYSKGYKILLAKDINVQHLDRISFGKLMRRMHKMGSEKMEHFFKSPETRKMDVSKTHHPLSLILSIAISPLMLLLAILSCNPLMRTAFALSVILFAIINSRFFLFLAKEKGIAFMLRGAGIFFLVCLLIVTGFMRGAVRAFA